MARVEADAGAPGAAAAIRVELVRSPRAGEVERTLLTLAAGATVGEALAACGWAPGSGLRVAVWGRLLPCDGFGTTPLADRDRIELLRPLAVDPMEARRRREHAQRPAGRAGGTNRTNRTKGATAAG